MIALNPDARPPIDPHRRLDEAIDVTPRPDAAPEEWARWRARCHEVLTDGIDDAGARLRARVAALEDRVTHLRRELDARRERDRVSLWEEGKIRLAAVPLTGVDAVFVIEDGCASFREVHINERASSWQEVLSGARVRAEDESR